MEITIIFFNVKNTIIKIYLKYLMSLKNLIKLRYLAPTIMIIMKENFLQNLIKETGVFQWILVRYSNI